MRAASRAGGILVAALLAAGVVPSAAGAGEPAEGQAASTGRRLEPLGGALVAPGNAPDLVLLYTGDVLGYLEPCG